MSDVCDLGGHPALITRPRGARAAYLFAHGAGAGMRHAFMTAVADALAARGIAVARWELPYMAAGKARPDAPAVAERAVREAHAAFAKRFRALPRFAGGKSFGGRMTSRALAGASEPGSTLPGLRGVVFFGFPLHPPARRGGPRRGGPVDRAEHLAATAPVELLFLQGERDELAELPRLRPVVAALQPRATLHVVAHADHGFDVLVRSGREPAEVIAELADTASSWMLARA